jgi:hypothetical protein
MPPIHSSTMTHSLFLLDTLAGIVRVQAGGPSANGLSQATRDLARILVGGILEAPVSPDYFSQVAGHMIHFGDGSPFNGKYRDILKAAFVRHGILSLQAAATITRAKQRSGQKIAMVGRLVSKGDDLPMASISALSFGLRSATLKVHTAGESKHFAITSASTQLGPAEPRSPQSAAESYTEDLFQRGHVEIGPHGDREPGLARPHSFKTHVIVEENGELVLKRTTFDCGFDHSEE